jgi:polar amino acid transport system substrate-binding protein
MHFSTWRFKVIGLGCVLGIISWAFILAMPAQAMFPQSADQLYTTPPTRTVNPAPDTTESLTIVTRVVPPFVVNETSDGKPKYSGYSKALIDLIQVDLKQNGKAYGLTQAQQEVIQKPLNIHTVDEPTAEGLIRYVENGQANAAIASISITNERESRIDYSMPIFNSGLQTMRLAKNAPGPNVFKAFSSLMSKHEMHVLLLIAAAFILLIAHLIYMFERRHPKSPWYNERYPSGVFETAWWSVTTLVGQEDSHPRSGRSRLAAIGLIVFGVLFVAIFNASITSELTLQRIDDPVRGLQSLEGQRVITVRNSTSYDYLDNQQTPLKLKEIKTTDDIDQAYTLLKNGGGDAIVYDAAVLQYFAEHKGKGTFVTVGTVFHPEYYGIALPKDSPWREPFNRAILSLSESGELDNLRDIWLDKESIYQPDD